MPNNQSASNINQQIYIGRFAPAPTGPMHLGTLVSALASWLDCRSHSGKWLIRVDDLDKQRSSVQWGLNLLSSLQSHGLVWDEEATWQSQNAPQHQRAFALLAENTDQIFFCTCSRQKIQATQGCNAECKHRPISKEVDKQGHWRMDAQDYLRTLDTDSSAVVSAVQDKFNGTVQLKVPTDFVLCRNEAVTYNLACVVDDHQAQVNHIIRGRDLLEGLAPQIILQNLLQQKLPRYGHHTLILHENGRKHSKQNRSPALDSADVIENLVKGLHCLGQLLELTLEQAHGLTQMGLLYMAVENWQPDKMPIHVMVH